MTSSFQFLVFLAFCFSIGSSLRMERDFSYPTVEQFNVYWNVPTYPCKKFGFDFERPLKQFGIIGNSEDKFKGREIVILYDPGAFPALLTDSSGKTTKRNGGIPQVGDLEFHLKAFRKSVEESVPQNFQGVGIIDFEAWRPILRQNWNEQTIYKKLSEDLVRQRNPQWKEEAIRQAAAREFENGAKVFMESTLIEARRLRPRALWGYYAFPYCFNYRVDRQPKCADQVEIENNRIQWMFDESTALFPSLYMRNNLTNQDIKNFIYGRLNEAWRVAIQTRTGKIPLVHPYYWFKFNNSPNFLPPAVMETALEITKRYKMGGAIIWGSSRDTSTAENCEKLYKYVNNVLGPAVVKVKSSRDQGFVDTPFVTQVGAQEFRPPQQQRPQQTPQRPQQRPQRRPVNQNNPFGIPQLQNFNNFNNFYNPYNGFF